MPPRKRIVSTLDIYQPGPVYQVDYHGFGGHCYWGDYDDKSEAGFLDITEFAQPWVVPYTRGDFPTVPDYVSGGDASTALLGIPSVKILPSPVSAAINYPHMGRTAYHVDPYPGYSVESVVETNQNIDINYFSPIGCDQDKWTDGADGEYVRWEGFPIIYNQSSENPYLLRGVISQFKLPAEPIFSFAMWRPEAENETGTYKSFTIVAFSEVSELYDAYVLIIPANGKPKLFYGDMDCNSSGQTWINQAIELREVQGSGGGGGGSTEGAATWVGWRGGKEMSATVVWIGFFGPYIALSYDGFSSLSSVWWRTTGEPTLESPVGQFYPSGPSKVAIGHVGGQFAFAWIPPFTMDYGKIYSPVHRLPFDVSAMEAAGSASLCKLWAACPSTAPVYGGQYQFEGGMASVDQAVLFDESSRVPGDGMHGFDFSVKMRRRTYNSTLCKGLDGGDVDIYGFTTWSLDPWEALGISRAYNRFNITSGHIVGVYHHDQSACVFRADYMKNTVISSNSGRSYTRHYPSSFNYDESFDGNVAGATVDGTAAYSGDPDIPPFRDMHDDRALREVKLSGAYYDGDGNLSEVLDLIPGFGGYMAEPSTVIENGKVLTEAQMRDFQSAGLDVIVDGTLPVFDGWYVKTAIEWLLDYIGVGANLRTFWRRYYDGSVWLRETVSAIEDTGSYLNIGPVDKPFWVAEEGRPVMDLIAEMCLYDYGAALYCRNGGIFKGCPYCTAARTATIADPDYVWKHFDNGPYSSGCYLSDVGLSENGDGIFHHYTTLAGDAKFLEYVPVYAPLKHELRRIEVEPFDQSKYYNSVKVKGKSFVKPDEPRDEELTDWVSVHGDVDNVTTGYALGWKKQLELNYEWANTSTIRQRLARSHFNRVSIFTRTIKVTVPYDPNVHLGDTFAVHGPIADYALARDQVYRIESINHSNEASHAPVSTTLRGRWIWGIT